MLIGVAVADDPMVRFDFEDGTLQGWKPVVGHFPKPIRERTGTLAPKNRCYLSTCGRTDGDKARTVGGGIIESPVFVSGGGKATFQFVAKNGRDAGVSLHALDGAEVRRAESAQPAKWSRCTWDLAEFAGEPLFLRMTGRPLQPGCGSALLDDFAAPGRIDEQATRKRRQFLIDQARIVAEPLLDELGEIVFAVRQPGNDGHWYANFGHWASDPEKWLYGKRGRLCRLEPRSGELTMLLDDPEGTVRDPQVHYDGESILFAYRPGGTHYFHLYEIQSDGSGLCQLTRGEFDDVEPTYLPDGRIMFCSTRCKRWVNCMLSEVAVLYICDADGTNMRPVSSNIEHDNTPWPLADGRVIYTRWEYVDRSQVHYHHLWATNPDGTNQTVFYGNLHPGLVMIDAKPIPGTRQIVSVFSPGHGRREHAGPITIVQPALGPDDLSAAQPVSWEGDLLDPYPIGRSGFVVARGPRLMVMDNSGVSHTFYQLPDEERRASMICQEPRPLRSRVREKAVPDRVNLRETAGRLFLSNIYHGRNMAGVERGEIKELLVLEVLPKPVNFSGGMGPLSFGGTFSLERILGTVPVEGDGSAYFEAPALRSLFFVALDKNGLAVKRMQSFCTVQPGELTGCVGCHEQRLDTGRTEIATRIAGLRRPSRIEPIADVPDVIDFPRDIQPILDRHCTACHSYEMTQWGGPRTAGVVLCGDRGPEYSHSYVTLFMHGQVSDGRNLPTSNYAPRTLGSSASPLLKKFDGSHNGVRATPLELKTVRLWIDSGAVYPGTYAALGTGGIRDVRTASRPVPRDPLEPNWPAAKAARDVYARRCNACHAGEMELPRSPADLMDVKAGRMRKTPMQRRMSRHLLYNLTRPKKSLLLLAPLARRAGGYQACTRKSGKPSILADTEDSDYQILLALVRETEAIQDSIGRFDMPGFRPNDHYIREIKRYGILPVELDPDADPIDVYATDRAYWRSLWFRPRRD